MYSYWAAVLAAERGRSKKLCCGGFGMRYLCVYY